MDVDRCAQAKAEATKGNALRSLLSLVESPSSLRKAWHGYCLARATVCHSPEPRLHPRFSNLRKAAYSPTAVNP